jgi:glycosyltransferase involved in cell wall biosynthesis
VHVLYLIDSLGRAGAEQSLATMAPLLVSRGVRLDVAYLVERPGLHRELVRAGATLIPLSRSAGRWKRIREAALLLSARRPDLIHTTLFEADILGRIAGKRAGIPVVSSLVSVAYGPEQLADPTLTPWKVRAAQLVDATTARAVRRFHAVTGHVAEVMAKRLGIRRDRIDVIPRGRDPLILGSRTAERRALFRRSLGVPEQAPLIVAVARHERSKGLDVLFEALPRVLSEVPSVRVVVAGREGNQTAALRGLIRGKNLDGAVDMLGARNDVPEILCAADVFVLPSRWEGLPGALLESMALEAPIVASDLPVTREVVGPAALLVPPEQPRQLAAAILSTLTGKEEARGRAGTARSRFLEHFTVDRVAGRMVDFYERALASPVPRASAPLGPAPAREH